MTESVILFVAGGFGLGWLPWAPGTFGSLLGLPLAWWMLRHTPRQQILIAATLVAMALLLCHWASIRLGGGDASQIVADEFLAFPVAVIGLTAARSPWVMAAAFLLFRLFDTTKPLFISHIETIGGGMGIVLDDVAAAIYVWIVLSLGIAFWNRYRKTKKAGHC